MSRYWPTSWSRREPGPLSEDEREWLAWEQKEMERRERAAAQVLISPTSVNYVNDRGKQLKVFGGNLDGSRRAILACHSMAEFVRATRISRNFASETGNAEEIAKAMSAPGTVFARPYLTIEHNNPWEAIARYDRPSARRAPCGRDPKHCDEWYCCVTWG